LEESWDAASRLVLALKSFIFCTNPPILGIFEVADKAGGFGAGATLCRVYNGNCLADAIPNKNKKQKRNRTF